MLLAKIFNILGNFWAILGHFRSFLGHYFCAIFFGQKCISAIFITFSISDTNHSFYGLNIAINASITIDINSYDERRPLSRYLTVIVSKFLLIMKFLLSAEPFLSFIIWNISLKHLSEANKEKEIPLTEPLIEAE